MTNTSDPLKELRKLEKRVLVLKEQFKPRCMPDKVNPINRRDHRPEILPFRR